MPPPFSYFHTCCLYLNGNGKGVLLIDDDADAGFVMAALLEQIGYNTVQVYDGVHALEALNKRCFDVVIANYPMLSICGMELLNYIHARGLETSVILLSEMPTNTMSIDKGLCPFAWLRKPYEGRGLLDLVSSAAQVAGKTGKEDHSAPQAV